MSSHLDLRAFGATLFVSGLVSACIQVEADLPQTCFLESDVSIAAVEVAGVGVQGALDAAADAGFELPDDLPPVAVQESFRRDGLSEIPQAIDEAGVEASLALLFVDVTAVQGLETFESIDRVIVTVAPTDSASGLDPIVLAGCDASAGCDVSGRTVTLSGDAQRDLLPYLRAGELEFTLELEGSPPLEVWAFDVDVCMQGDASYTYAL